MKILLTSLVAIMSTALVSAAPSSNLASLFERQGTCAAINQACLNASTQSTLSSILNAVPFITSVLGGLTVTQAINQLACCPGSTCAGGTAPLPAFLTPVAVLVSGLPYQSCTNN